MRDRRDKCSTGRQAQPSCVTAAKSVAKMRERSIAVAFRLDSAQNPERRVVAFVHREVDAGNIQVRILLVHVQTIYMQGRDLRQILSSMEKKSTDRILLIVVPLPRGAGWLFPSSYESKPFRFT
jgi:hypothetical protein